MNTDELFADELKKRADSIKSKIKTIPVEIEKPVYHHRWIKVSAVSAMFIICIFTGLYFINSNLLKTNKKSAFNTNSNNMSLTKNKTNENSRVENNAPIISASPMIFCFYEWQNKYYSYTESPFLSSDKIGNFLGKNIRDSFYEIKQVDPNKSIAVKYVNDYYIKLDFFCNSTITFNGHDYSIDPYHGYFINEDPDSHPLKLGELIGEIDSMRIYSIEDTNKNARIALQLKEDYYLTATRK